MHRTLKFTRCQPGTVGISFIRSCRSLIKRQEITLTSVTLEDHDRSWRTAISDSLRTSLCGSDYIITRSRVSGV